MMSSSSLLHSSQELNRNSDENAFTTTLSMLTDADGLRCEVRSMRSVPHALYTLPSISHVVATHVRQLMEDFVSSLLLCRPQKVVERIRKGPGSRDAKDAIAVENTQFDTTDAEGEQNVGSKKKKKVPASVVRAGLALEDEETYLLLRLFAHEAQQRRRARQKYQRQQQDATRIDGGAKFQATVFAENVSDSEEEEENEDDDVGGVSDWLWDAPSASSPQNDVRQSGVSALTKVEQQLLTMFAAAVDDARRNRKDSTQLESFFPASVSSTTPSPMSHSFTSPLQYGQRRASTGLGGAAQASSESAHNATTPPLLSSLLRFKPLLQDMQFLSRHLLLPRHAWPHHQREWVSVYEDVGVTLRDRLLRYRATALAENTAATLSGSKLQANADRDDGEDDSRAAESHVSRRRQFPEEEIEHLWHVLWELLGAAWRQRDRLWGAYRHVHGPRKLPPLMLNSQAAQGLPPGVHASPILRDQYTRHIMQTSAAAAATTAAGDTDRGGQRTSSSAPSSALPQQQQQQQNRSVLPPSVTAAHAEDCCAFGPFTSAGIGIASDAEFVLRQPLAAVMRSLSVCVPPAGRDSLVTSTTAFAGFKYVDEPNKRSSATPAPNATSSPANGGGSSSSSSHAVSRGYSSPTAALRLPAVVPLFDVTDEDTQLRQAVPYLSPEVFLAQQLMRAGHGVAATDATTHAPVHLFSDDVWNAAVVVLEAALCEFDVSDMGRCHLATPTYAHTDSADDAASTQNLSKQQQQRTSRQGGGSEAATAKDASPDARPPSPRTDDSPSPQQSGEGDVMSFLSVSVYVDVVEALQRRHGLAKAAAHNFLYAALFHLQAELKTYTTEAAAEEKPSATKRRAVVTGPCPRRLAEEWMSYLHARYDGDFIARVLANEVALKGLCWRRSERWNAFGLAHATVAASSTVHVQPSPSSTPVGGADGRAGFSASLNNSSSMRSGDRRLADPTATHAVEGEESFRPTAGTPLANDKKSYSSPNDAPPNAADYADATRRRPRPHPPLTVTLPSQLNSASSLDVLQLNSGSAMQSPLRGGSPASSTTTNLARLPQRLDRAVNALDTPLLRLFALPGSMGGAPRPSQPSSALQTTAYVVEGGGGGVDQVWQRLARFLHHCSQTGRGVSTTSHAPHSPTSHNSASSGAGGWGGKANGAVADAADVDAVEELLHLLYSCVVTATLSQGTASSTADRNRRGAAATEAEEKARFAAVNHPFLRGVAERGLLTTYMTVCGRSSAAAAVNDDGVMTSALPSLNLYVPTRVLLATLRKLETHNALGHAIAAATTATTTSVNGVGSRAALATAQTSRDRLAVASDLVQEVEKTVRQTGTLRTLIGDNVRAWEAARDLSRRSRGGYPAYLAYSMATASSSLPSSSAASSPLAGVKPSHQSRAAVESAMSSMECSLPQQLHHIAQLRSLLYTTPSGPETLNSHGGGVGWSTLSHHAASKSPTTAQAVQKYLCTHFAIVTTTTTTAASSSTARNGGIQILHQSNEGGEISSNSSGNHHNHILKRNGTTKVRISPFFVVPATLRGEVWGCLLRVPPARKREAFLAHAVHRTAAKPSLNDRQLSVDIPRCHAYHPLLATSRGSAQLQRILKAWLFLHPRYAYWQGLDSVCAVLLTVSPQDEALVLAQLSAVVDRFIAHDEGAVDGLGSRSSLLQQQQPSVVKPSMSGQLHRLTVVLRYADPLLAHYLFNTLACTPELFAISWMLTLFSHSLPTRKVYLLWDLLFVHGEDSTCLVALCAAVMLRKRATLLSTDFSGCLSAFSSGASSLDVVAAVADTRQLLRALPPSVLSQPLAEELSGARGNAESLYTGGGYNFTSSREVDGSAAMSGGRTLAAASAGAAFSTSRLAYLSVEDLRAAFAAAKARSSTAVLPSAGSSEYAHQQQQHHWSDSGVYLVDVRSEYAHADALLGAIHLPLTLHGSPPPLFTSATATSTRSSVNSSVAGRYDFASSRVRNDSFHLDAAGEGWGIVEDQERLQERQQARQEAQERHIADAAAELVRHLSNPAVAAITPRLDDVPRHGNTSAGNDDTNDGSGVWDSGRYPPWEVHPMVLKTSMAPHVVLVASGGGGGGHYGSASGEYGSVNEDLELAHQLGVQLNACGVHNVSVLLGGMAGIRATMPEMVVTHSQTS